MANAICQLCNEEIDDEAQELAEAMGTEDDDDNLCSECFEEYR